MTPRQGAGYENQDLDLGPDSPGCRRHGLGPPNTQPQWAKVSTVTMTVSVPLRGPEYGPYNWLQSVMSFLLVLLNSALKFSMNFSVLIIIKTQDLHLRQF